LGKGIVIVGSLTIGNWIPLSIASRTGEYRSSKKFSIPSRIKEKNWLSQLGRLSIATLRFQCVSLTLRYSSLEATCAFAVICAEPLMVAPMVMDGNGFPGVKPKEAWPEASMAAVWGQSG
jgi:hypothetical protein